MTEAEATKAVADKLVGNTITSVSYMSEEIAKDWGFSRRPITLMLSDGHQLIILADDEANDGGSVFTSYEDLQIVPTLRFLKAQEG